MASFEPGFAMSKRDTDFEFDFFDEPETQEASGRERPFAAARRPRASVPRGPIRPPRGLHAAAAPASG